MNREAFQGITGRSHPDAEANLIRNLMEQIDQLESQVRSGKAQSLKDRKILEFLGVRIES